MSGLRFSRWRVTAQSGEADRGRPPGNVPLFWSHVNPYGLWTYRNFCAILMKDAMPSDWW